MATNPLSGIRVYDPSTANQPKIDDGRGTDTSPAAQTQNFLKLLIAQIQNQDPMAPMDASTMTAQMSQLNMVSSIATMNSSMTAMLSQMQSANFLNQASLIGHSPAVAGGEITYIGSGDVTMALQSDTPLQSVVATLTDSGGNLVNTVKGYAAHEKETLEAVIRARSAATSFQITPEVLSNPDAFKKFQEVQGHLSSALSRLMAVSERYPNLKADMIFRDLQSQLEGTENRITVARQRYIVAVQEYNVLARSFPTNLTAKIFLTYRSINTHQHIQQE